MKSNSLTTILNWALAASAILSIVFFIQYFFRTRELRTLQPQVQMEVAKYNNAQVFVKLLSDDLTEYSKHDPGILPLLKSVSAKPAQTGEATNPPAAH